MDHPAKFSPDIISKIQQAIPEGWWVLDPFAGTGRIHCMGDLVTFGNEIEWEWASLSGSYRDVQGDALHLPFADGVFDAIATSPCYGNRMADHHDARDGSKRITYKHVLGRDLHPNNSGQFQWGHRYRAFHERAWDEALRVLARGGKFLLNSKDHIRGGEHQPVTLWHAGELARRGCILEEVIEVDAPGMRRGENYDKRFAYERIMVFSYG